MHQATLAVILNSSPVTQGQLQLNTKLQAVIVVPKQETSAGINYGWQLLYTLNASM